MTHARFGALVLALPLTLFWRTDEPKELPLKYSGPPTVPAITAGDLMTRLYIFADDSMGGRRVGTEYNDKGTAYIEREVRKLGLKPAGDSGGYFMRVPVISRLMDTSSTIATGNTTFHGGVDFIAATGTAGVPRELTDATVVYGGMQLDTMAALPADSVRGRILVLRAFSPTPTFNPMASLDAQRAFIHTLGYAKYLAEVSAAGAVMSVFYGDRLPPAAAMAGGGPEMATDEPARLQIVITSKALESIFTTPIGGATAGMEGQKVTTNIKFVDKQLPARNVVAIMPGSDPKLRGEYVAIGAHSDHIGFRQVAVDHDSLRAFNEVVRPQGADSPNRQPTTEDWARIGAMIDSLHKLHGGPRRDSINNGADDDGSGTVSALEIAEAFAKGPIKPKRSILFIWHTGEEAGLWGSEYFTDHPTVPRDSIVAELNMDMVGRGRATDVTGDDKDGKELHGGPGYLQIVGSRRLSTELGDLIEKVNTEKKLGLNFDYAMDANGHPENIYCRSDHYEYARYGIPIAFFTTGGHADYHQVTDEPQYIDYEHMAQVDSLVYQTAIAVADLDHRVVVDHPKPDPHGACVQ